MRSLLATLVLVAIGAMLVFMVAEMPTFGEPGPAFNEVTKHYLDNTVTDTGAVNVITAIILDYRAYDTLGEATVLFSGIGAAMAVLVAHHGKRGDK
jgi:multisubunit Na+/H+ antiporter MnhB subunit